MEIVPVDDGIVVLEPDRGGVAHLNNTAAAVLALCDGTRTVEQIAGALSRKFSLDAPPVQQTRRCVEALSEAGLVK
jgi:Coenzyme PQQ synthesis protein D (PqqD)